MSLPLASSSEPTFSSLAPSAPLPLFILHSVLPSVLPLSFSSSVPSFPLRLFTSLVYSSAAPSSSLAPLPSFLLLFLQLLLNLLVVFQLRALFLRLRSLPLLFLQLPRSPPLLPSPLLGALWGSSLYLLCLSLLRRCSVSLRTFRRWIVGLWPPGVRLFALILLFAILLSFLVFMLTLLWFFSLSICFVFLCFDPSSLLCSSLCLFGLCLPWLQWIRFPFSSSLVPSAVQHRFIAHSLTFLSSAGSSSSSSHPRVLWAPPVYSASSVLVLLRGSVRSLFLVLYLLLSRLLLSSPSFRWGSNSFRGGSCGYSPFDFPFHPFCSGVLSGYFFVIFCHSSSFSFGSFLRCSRWFPGDAAPSALLHDTDSAVHAAVPGLVRSESRHMLAFLRVCFPQAEGVHSAPPSFVFWSWSVRVPMVLFLMLILAWSLFFLRVVPPSSPSSQLGFSRPGCVRFGAFLLQISLRFSLFL